MELSQLQKYFNDFVEKQNQIKDPENLYEPIQYILNLGGKRIRPILNLLAYNMYREDLSRVVPISYAIELFHNFTLMHDDIMDEALLRRGATTVHKKYSLNASILSGDAMLLTAYSYLLGADLNIEELTLFNNTAIEICEGQQMDLDFETSNDVSIEAYLKMIKLKTAVLLGLSLQLGASKAGAPKSDIQHLYNFGINIGIAFQLHDDMLDAFGSSQNTGKKQGGDILQRKQTYLHLKTIELLDGQEKLNYLKIFNDNIMSDANRLKGVMSYYHDTVVKEYSLQSEEAYFNLAMSHLEAVSVAPNKKATLIALSHQLMEREK